MARSMESILSDEPSVHSLPDTAESDSSGSEASETPAAETTSEKPEAKATDKAPAAPKVAAKAAKDDADDDSDDGAEPQDHDGFKKALAAARGDKRKARKKWQEVEREKALLEGELNALRRQAVQPQAKPETQEPKEPTEAELEAEYWTNPVAFTRKYGAQAQGPSAEEVATRTKIELSVYHTKRAYPDYDEKLAAFKRAADAQPHLWDYANRSPDPGGFVYDHGSQLVEVESFGGDLNAWRDAERAKLRAEIEAERGNDNRSSTPVKPIPKSIAGARGSGAGGTQAWSGPRSMEDILAPH